MTDGNSETWRDIPGYAGIYQASDLGRVRRSPAAPLSQSKKRDQGLVLKPWVGRAGSLRVRLWDSGRKSKGWQVHHLVMLAFVGPRPAGCEVNHKDGNRQNNRVDNLEYCTHAENQRHASITGLMAVGDRHGTKTHPHRVARGERQGGAKLTAGAVIQIRAALQAGSKKRPLAKRYGVSDSLIGRIATRKVWAHLA